MKQLFKKCMTSACLGLVLCVQSFVTHAFEGEMQGNVPSLFQDAYLQASHRAYLELLNRLETIRTDLDKERVFRAAYIRALAQSPLWGMISAEQAQEASLRAYLAIKNLL